MRYFIVDAFAKDAFTGNPAAVVLVDRTGVGRKETFLEQRNITFPFREI